MAARLLLLGLCGLLCNLLFCVRILQSTRASPLNMMPNSFNAPVICANVDSKILGVWPVSTSGLP